MIKIESLIIQKYIKATLPGYKLYESTILYHYYRKNGGV
jgi:hypothetical protein